MILDAWYAYIMNNTCKCNFSLEIIDIGSLWVVIFAQKSRLIDSWFKFVLNSSSHCSTGQDKKGRRRNAKIMPTVKFWVKEASSFSTYFYFLLIFLPKLSSYLCWVALEWELVFHLFKLTLDLRLCRMYVGLLNREYMENERQGV